MDVKSSRSGSFSRTELKERRRALLNRLARPAGQEPLRVFCSGIGGASRRMRSHKTNAGAALSAMRMATG